MENEARNQAIVKASRNSIITNIVLASFKAVIGVLTSSISITLDAINNLSDAMSSIITIVGTKLSVKEPDQKHPLGYGRVEYLSAMLVSGLVFYAGITSFVESVKKMVHPLTPTYTMTSIVILAVFVLVKYILSEYVLKVGLSENSMALIASAKDARFDAILSTSVLVSMFVYLKTSVLIDAYIGVVLALVILKASIEMMKETLDEILGKRADYTLTTKIKQRINEFDEVHGSYDLILHSYGVNRYIGSVHIEVDDVMNAEEIDELSRRIANTIYDEFGVLLTGIGIYSRNTTDDDISRIYNDITTIVMKHDGVIQMHGFYVDLEKKKIHFDIIIDFTVKDRNALFELIKQEVSDAYSEFEVSMIMDIDI